MDSLPRLVVADNKGNIFVHPKLNMLGFDGKAIRTPSREELISLPGGSKFFYLPGHVAFGYDKIQRKIIPVLDYKHRGIYPVATHLIPGFTRLLHPAAVKIDLKLTLPLWAYTAVGYRKGKFVTSAVQIDRRKRQWPFYYQNRKILEKKVQRVLKGFGKNRLIKHLAHCALNYNCLAAKNLFYQRWEAPLPVSMGCNARCLGCLSFQDSDCAVSSHSRIKFSPLPAEVAEVGLKHIKKANEPIVSFGQGCEGEPLLEFDVLCKAISLIRKKTKKGTIHLNTNAYNPDKIKQLAGRGLDSIRVSINSFQDKFYKAYFKPRNYSLKDVLTSIRTAKKSGLFVSINLLVFPGFTDTNKELHLVSNFLKKGYIDMVQWRNLCIDSAFFADNMPKVTQSPSGVYRMIRRLRRKNPHLIFGYFNLPKERFRRGYSSL